MFCKNCGKEVNPDAAICVGCGVKIGEGLNYCGNCGQPVAPDATACTSCGFATNNIAPGTVRKSKVTAGLLGIFLGAFGVHNFYLGYTGKAVGQLVLSAVGLLLSCVGFGVFLIIGAEIWGFIEGIMILAGSIGTDAKGNPLGN